MAGRGLLDLDPNIVKRGLLLPFGRTADNDLEFALPQLAVDFLNSAMLPGAVLQGHQATPEETTDLALNMLMFGAPAAAATVPRGALGSLGGSFRPSAGPFIPREILPRGLRERFFSILMRASGDKDPFRIKLTPERMEKAKAELLRQMEDRQAFLKSPFRTTQMKNAIEFAETAKRAGNDVRVKIPDGDLGSVYVRVGDKGTVRFSDHSQPTGPDGKPVGGYSKTLGRRHRAALLSVDPHSGVSLDDVKGLLAPD